MIIITGTAKFSPTATFQKKIINNYNYWNCTLSWARTVPLRLACNSPISRFCVFCAIPFKNPRKSCENMLDFSLQNAGRGRDFYKLKSNSFFRGYWLRGRGRGGRSISSSLQGQRNFEVVLPPIPIATAA